MSDFELIKAVASYADRRASSPIWEAVYFEPGRVYAGSHRIEAYASIELDQGTFALSADRLMRALRAVSGTPKIEVQKTQVVFTAGKSKATLPKQISHPFDLHVAPKGLKWVGGLDQLAQTKSVSWCVGSDLSRAHLMGVSLSDSGLVATNGISMARLGGVDYNATLGITGRRVFDVSLFSGISASVEACYIEHDRLFLRQDQIIRSAPSLSEDFPKIEPLIISPLKQPHGVVSREALLDVVRRARLSHDTLCLRYGKGRLSLNIDSRGGDQMALFDFADSVDVDFGTRESWGEGLEISASGKLLQAAIEQADDEIKLHLGDSLDPICLVSDDSEYLSIVMPLRV
jgi:hypothetical protein